MVLDAAGLALQSAEGRQTIRDLERAVRDLTRAQDYLRDCQVTVRVINPAAVQQGWAIGHWVPFLDRNPFRVKTAMGRHSGAGVIYVNTRNPSSAPTGPHAGLPINAAWPPYIEDAPFVHKGEWYMTADAVDTWLYVVEYSIAQGRAS